MNRRIHEALDDELPREALTGAEAAELDAFEEAADAALAAVRRETAPDVSATVMRRVSALPAHGATAAEPGVLRRALEWLWSPTPIAIRLRPAYGLAVAAAVALLIVAPWSGGGPGQTAAPPALAGVGPAEAQQVFVHFRLDVADARSVQLAGDFTDWQPRHSLREVAPGVWSVVVPVSAGVHQYSFVVDGERWVVDPAAPAVDDGFGGSNSRLDVITPAAGAAL